MRLFLSRKLYSFWLAVCVGVAVLLVGDPSPPRARAQSPTPVPVCPTGYTVWNSFTFTDTSTITVTGSSMRGLVISSSNIVEVFVNNVSLGYLNLTPYAPPTFYMVAGDVLLLVHRYNPILVPLPITVFLCGSTTITPTSTPTAIPTVPLAMVGVYSSTLALVPQQSDVWQLTTYGNGTGTALVLLAASVLMLALARYIRHLARP